MDACLPKDATGNLIADQERSDIVHDLLAFLAERMLEMNKEKQQEIKGFLGWQEGFAGARVENLTPNTKQQSYYELDYEGFLAGLKRNRKKLAVDPTRREPAKALRAEFKGSVGKLAPLQVRIGQTDDLIGAGPGCRGWRGRIWAALQALSRLDGICTKILSLCMHHAFIRIMRIQAT